MNQIKKNVITAQAELRRLDLSKVPVEMRCPTCGDLLRALHHIVYEGSPILYCDNCRKDGQGFVYYHVAPRGLVA